MKEQDYKFYSELRTKSIPLNEVPKSIKNSLHFQNLFAANTLDTVKSGRGSKVVVKNINSFECFFSNHFSEEDGAEVTRYSNIKKLRNSKARGIKSKSVFFIRGFRSIQLNGGTLDLAYFTTSFGLFSVRQPKIEANKICFVENLTTFLQAEKLFGNEFIYLHKYGRVGIESLANISATEVLVFVDYDFNGLDEYLRIKSVYASATLFIPENFDELFKDYSRAIDGKQQQSDRVAKSNLQEVIRIRELVAKTNYFLEQEILIHD